MALEPWGPGAFPILPGRSWLQQLPGPRAPLQGGRAGGRGGPVLTPGPELGAAGQHTSVLRARRPLSQEHVPLQKATVQFQVGFTLRPARYPR